MEDRTVIEWDKDDLDALGLLKVDVLALGMLTASASASICWRSITEATLTLRRRSRRRIRGLRHDLQGRHGRRVPDREPRADVDAAAAASPKLLRSRHRGGDRASRADPGRHGASLSAPPRRHRAVSELPQRGAARRCWARRWACRCSRNRRCRSPSSRRASRPERPTSCAAPWRPSGMSGRSSTFRDKFIAGMKRTAISAEFAERCFSQIEGFGEYGFPESHAASFALLVYVLLDQMPLPRRVSPARCSTAQPMGFYAPAQLVRDFREHGVEVREADINLSDWDCTLEPRGRSMWRTPGRSRAAARLPAGEGPERGGCRGHR